ncbi:MAG: hypothetical protein M3405_04575 [Acidobacteriota bacterium]|nr:hypothetical protein [Acidobacteriota bacterium]
MENVNTLNAPDIQFKNPNQLGLFDDFTEEQIEVIETGEPASNFLYDSDDDLWATINTR